MLGMLLTENQQLQCRPRCSAQCPVLCTATAHYVECGHPPDVWDLDTSNTGAGWRLHSTLYITSPSPPPPIVIVVLRHGPAPRSMQTRLAGAGVQRAVWWRARVSGSLGLRLKLIQPSPSPHTTHNSRSAGIVLPNQSCIKYVM